MNLFKTLCLAVTLLCIHTNGLSQASDKNGNHAVNTLLRPSISLHTGVSVPFGKFRDKSNWSDQTSAANEGFVTEISGSLFPRKHSRWQTCLLFGYMYNPFEVTADQTRGLQSFSSSDWHVGYGMVGLQYTSPTRIYYGIDAFVGLLLFDGGNIKFNERKNHLQYVEKSYEYPVHSYIAIKGGIRLGYKLAERLKIDVFAQLMYAPSHREGQYKQSTYRLNRASEELVYVHEEMIQNQTSIMTINMGISIHYLLISMDSEKPIYALSEK